MDLGFGLWVLSFVFGVGWDFWTWVLGCRIWGWGVAILGLWFSGFGMGFRVQAFGFELWGWDSGFGVFVYIFYNPFNLLNHLKIIENA